MNIAILYGGKTGEHEVSMVSASSVARNIDSTKHNINLISISKEGLWYLQPTSELEKVQKDAKAILSDKPTSQKILVIPGEGTNSGLCVLENGKVEYRLFDKDFGIATGDIKTQFVIDEYTILVSINSLPLPPDPKTIVFGEVGLSGEVRAVNMPEQRVAEAKKLGFQTCIIPEVSLDMVKGIKGIQVIGVKTIGEAIRLI